MSQVNKKYPLKQDCSRWRHGRQDLVFTSFQYSWPFQDVYYTKWQVYIKKNTPNQPNHSPRKCWPRNNSPFTDTVSLLNGTLAVLPHVWLLKVLFHYGPCSKIRRYIFIQWIMSNKILRSQCYLHNNQASIFLYWTLCVKYHFQFSFLFLFMNRTPKRRLSKHMTLCSDYKQTLSKFLAASYWCLNGRFDRPWVHEKAQTLKPSSVHPGNSADT